MTSEPSPGAPPRRDADGSRVGETAGPDASASEAFRDAAVRLGEIGEYASYYLAVKADAAKLMLRNGLFFAVLGIFGLFAAVAAVVVAVTLVLIGIADVLGEALGGRIWLGDLIVGVVILAAIAIAAGIGIRMVLGTTRKQTVEKYESRKRDQRTRFGHDVKQRAES